MSTTAIECLAGPIDQHTRDGVKAGIGLVLQQLRTGGRLDHGLPINDLIWRWDCFNGHILKAKAQARQAAVEQRWKNAQALRRAAEANRQETVRRAAEAAIAQLKKANIKIDESRLLYTTQLGDLMVRFPSQISPEEVLPAAIEIWLRDPMRRENVRSWSNLHEAIRVASADYLASGKAVMGRRGCISWEIESARGVPILWMLAPSLPSRPYSHQTIAHGDRMGVQPD